MESGSHKPPPWILKVLRWYCPPQLFEEIEGDLIQQFERDAKRYSERKARRRLLWNALRFFRLGILLRNKFSWNTNPSDMIFNYFKIAHRHLMNSKAYSLINVTGLAVGITAFLLIVQYVHFELSYDQFHANSDNIYRVGLERYKKGEPQTSSSKNFAGLKDLLRENFPEVNAVTGFYKTPANTGVFFRYKGKVFNELGGQLNTDSSFFKVFPSILVKGDATTALQDRHGMVVSESMAKKIFGDEEPMGQHIQTPNDGDRESERVITGVFKDFPPNSHMHANFVVRQEEESKEGDEWSQAFLLTYISLKEEHSPETISNRLNQLYRRLEVKYPEMKETKSFLQPITSIHLSSQLQDELEVNGSKNLVYVASVIALIILILAWINYINLETARFATRAREVSVRRIIGSAKSDLALQFLIEYFCALIVAIGLAALLLAFLIPRFSYLTGIPIDSIQWSQPTIWVIAFGVLITGSILVGIYPAMFLLRLNPATTLRGKFDNTNKGRAVRKSLIIVQFSSSLILIACVLVMRGQLDFMQTVDKKFDVNNVITLRNPTAYSSEEVIEKHSAYRTLENKLMANASVQMVSSSSAIPGTEIGFTYVNRLKRNVNDPYDPTPFKTLFVDYNYIPFYELNLLAGRNFDPPRPIQNWINPWEDENWLNLILNKSAIHALGFESPEAAVDKMVEFQNFEDHFQKHRIIGVVEDYHHEAVKKEIFPMIFSPNYGSFQQVYYSIRLNEGSNKDEAIADIKKSWTVAFPDKPFEYSFLDEYYDQQFKSELYSKRIFSVFAGVAVFIGCLGIFGMTLFEASARQKEIIIRKVLGASATNLIALLSRDNVRLVLISAAIATPLIYFIAQEWLSGYPMRIDLSPMFFLMPLTLILLVVATVSSFQTIKAANSNSVDHLKNE
jgi:putative ABC transport system permease protein